MTQHAIGDVLPMDFDGNDQRAQQYVRELDAGKTLAANRMVKAGFGPIHSSHIKMAKAVKRSAAEHLEEVVDVFLADKSSWSGGPPLPAARPPIVNLRVRR